MFVRRLSTAVPLVNAISPHTDDHVKKRVQAKSNSPRRRSKIEMDSQSAASIFSKLEICPLDSTYALKELFLADDDARKVLLGAGVYRDNDSRPWVLPVVKKVCIQLLAASRALAAHHTIGRRVTRECTGYRSL